VRDRTDTCLHPRVAVGDAEEVKSAIYYFKKFDEDLSGELDHDEFVEMCRDMKWDAKSTAMSLVYLDTDGESPARHEPSTHPPDPPLPAALLCCCVASRVLPQVPASACL
jgi:hypothetical protein